MSRKSEIIKVGFLAALVAFGMIGIFAVVAAPGDGIVVSAHALRDANPSGSPHGPGQCGCAGSPKT